MAFLLIVAGVFYQCGFFLEYLFGSLTNWRTAAGISACIPILTAIYIALVLLSYSSIIHHLSILLQPSRTAEETAVPHRNLHNKELHTLHFFLLARPKLFAICNNTFSKWWEG
jgi:hypothetical protein